MRFIAVFALLCLSIISYAQPVPGDPVVYQNEVRDAALDFSKQSEACASGVAAQRAVCDAKAMAAMQIKMAKAKAKLANTPWEFRTATHVEQEENARVQQLIDGKK